jgi:hypothetical protein
LDVHPFLVINWERKWFFGLNKQNRTREHLGKKSPCGRGAKVEQNRTQKILRQQQTKYHDSASNKST